jgi:hypothetical protein
LANTASLTPDDPPRQTANAFTSFRDDLRDVREPLREARNAVMHVSEEAYYDDRLFKIMNKRGSAATVRRVHRGYARLLLTELEARRHAGS